MNLVLLGNLVALLGAAAMVASGFLKKKNHILAVQCGQFVVLSAAHVILGAYSGIIANVVGIARNLVCMKREFTAAWKITFIAAQLVLSLAFNTNGWLGLLPAAASCIYTCFLDLRDERKLKLVIIVSTGCWVVFDFLFQNYVTFAFDIATIVSNMIGIYSLQKAAKPS